MTRGIIVAGHPQTAQAARQILEAGGNAIDAAIAAFTATFVTEFCMSSPGGGAFANVYTAADRQTRVYDFFCQTPKVKRPTAQIDFYPTTLDFGTAQEDFHIGMGAIGVPGSVAGMYALHEHHGTLPMTDLVRPAVQLAQHGALVDDFQYYDLNILKAIVQQSDEASDIFLQNRHTVVPAGQNIYMLGMADFLTNLAHEGKDLFYKGAIAAQLHRDSQEKGGHITRTDLEDYTVRISPALTIPYHQYSIHTNPLPSIGGSIIALHLHHLRNTPKPPIPVDHPHHIRQLYQIFTKIAAVKKTPKNLQQHLENILTIANKKRGSTTHLNVLDEYGNAVAITTTNGEGCGYMIPNTNIMMNNMLGEAALLPNGFHNWTPDTRLSSMMAPTIVLNNDHAIHAVLGTGGASRIPSAILQVLHYLIDHQLPVAEAVAAPRAHFQDGILNLEPGFTTDLNQLAFRNECRQWQEKAMYFGGVHTIARNPDGTYRGEGDDRRSGVVLNLM